MRFSAIALTLGAIATTVIADGASIVAALNTVDADTKALNTAVLKTDGSLIGSIPVLSATGKLLSDLDAGTKTAQQSAPLNTTEAVNVYFTVLTLQQDVNTTLSNLIAAEPKFRKNFLDGPIELILKTTKSKTDKFAAAIVNVVPADYQTIATGVVSSIDDSFTQAIAAYNH